MNNVIAALFGFAAGFFCIFCAYKDYDWFMNSSKARLWVRLLGRDGARKFYMGLGVVIVALGIMLSIVGF
ncbi:MAG: immunity 17 family protein [Ruminococcus sp.]|jgi:hypothetical protein|uniref:immunity 17 family protein n=1 Tax=Ruminococcus sp. TaxID=41978 RepID=UPI0025D39170|nr:immunity 17 family protein [Ruminococcus sp.]MCR5540717.1 immunity 17 family protein [Ruminococcus sp.]